MHVPGERASPDWISAQSADEIVPARFSSQNRHMSVPDASFSPRQFPRSIGPAGTNTVGSPAEAAPISNAGVVLSQPPISTQPSTG